VKPAKAINKRQREAIYLLSIGKGYAEAAAIMGTRKNTITRYVNRAKDATGCPTTIGLIGYALRNGIIA